MHHLVRKISAQDREEMLRPLADLVGSFSDRVILVTGGTGFFGKWLTQALCALADEAGSRHKLILWTRNSQRSRNEMPWLEGRKEVSWLEADIRAPLESGTAFDMVIHGATAASATLNDQNPMEMFDVIVEGTRNVLRECRSRRIQDVLFVSSGGIYGKQPEGLLRFPESYVGGHPPTSPTAAYGIGKTAAEFLSCAFARETGVRVLIARCFAFVGPYLPLDTHFAIGNFMNDVLNKRDIQIGGDGTPYRSYMYGTDLAVWLLKTLASGRSLQPYHIGSERAYSIREIAEHVAQVGLEVTGHSSQVRVAQAPTPGLAPARFIPSTEFTRRELGLSETVDLDEGIRRTLKWYLSKS